jgi:hypothetical protein
MTSSRRGRPGRAPLGKQLGWLFNAKRLKNFIVEQNDFRASLPSTGDGSDLLILDEIEPRCVDY